MNTLTRKIRALEKNVISDKPDPEDTYLGTNSKNEMELFKVAHKIMEEQKQRLMVLEERQKTNPTADYAAEIDEVLELSDEAEAIVSQAEHIGIHRAMHIFETVVACRYHLKDPANKTIFYMRFFWFLSEMKDWLHHLHMEQKIMGEPGFFDLCKGEQDKKLKTCYNSWRKWLSDESFNQWLKNNPITLPNVKTIEEATTDEEGITLIEKAYRAEEEKNVRYLKEKCPTCKDQCEWYKKHRLRGQNDSS